MSTSKSAPAAKHAARKPRQASGASQRQSGKEPSFFPGATQVEIVKKIPFVRTWQLERDVRSKVAATKEGELLIDLHHLDEHDVRQTIKDSLESGKLLHVRVSDGTLFHFSLEQTSGQSRDAEMQRLVDASESKTDKADAIQARMRAKAVALVMGGTSWLTATELFAELQKRPSNVHTVLARWLEQGRVFALEKNGVRIFPRYAFDPMLEPVPILKEVLKALAGRSPFQIAAWFESPSNHLNGKRPREVLELDGLAVVMAAKRQVEGAVHG